MTIPASAVAKSWLRLCTLGFCLVNFFYSRLLPLLYLVPLANIFIRLSSVLCSRQSWGFVLYMGKKTPTSEVTYMSSSFCRFPGKCVYPCCQLPVREAGFPPPKRGGNVSILIPQYLLVHVVLDTACE